MKEIQLTRSMVALVDDADFDHLNQRKWIATKEHQSFYAKRRCKIGGKSTITSMHRVLFNLKPGDRLFVDHKDHNGLNNQRSNLRLVTHSQNACNRRSGVRASSKYLGVSFHKGTRKWTATLGKDKRIIYLGVFETPELAAVAYNEAAKKYHGEFANLNII